MTRDAGRGRTAAVWELPAVALGMHAQDAALQRLLDDGADLIGWKVGVGSPAAMERAGIPAPLVGFLTSATREPSGVEVAVAGWNTPMLEPELAIHLDADVDPGADRETVAAAIGGLAPAIELADVDVPLEDLERVVAGNVFHRRVILGEADRGRRGGDVSGLRARITKNGEEVAASADLAELAGEPVGLVAHVAEWLEVVGRPLESGHVIIGGSVVPIIPVRPGDTVAYHCEPIGAVAVTLTS